MPTTRHHTTGSPPVSTPARTPASTPARRWGLLVTVAIGLLLITLDSSILFTALPTLSDQLDATASETLWIINAYPVVMAGLLLGSGALSDRIGHRRMFLLGLVIFGAASGAAAAATTPEALIAARAALAIGAAAMMPASLALIRVTFEDERERNLAVAVWGSIAVVGAALGPVLGGLLLTQFWWGSVFLVNVPVVVLALGATAALAPATPPDPKAHWDAPSSALALIALTSLVVSIKEVASPDRSWTLTAVALGLSALAAWRFLARQTRLSHPLLDTAVFRNPRFSAGVIAAAFALFTIVGIQLVSTQRFQLVEGLTPLQSGLLVACLALGTLPTAMLSGALGHRIGELPLISGGLLVAALGVFSVVLLQPAGLAWTALGLGLIGAGLGSVMALASATIINNVPAERAGMASSLEEVSYEMGSLSAVAVLGSVLAASTAAAGGSTPGLTASEGVLAGFTSALLITAGVVAAGAVLTAWLLRRGHPRPTTAAGSSDDGSHAREPA